VTSACGHDRDQRHGDRSNLQCRVQLNGRFYETSDRVLGMTPSNRAGGALQTYASLSANALWARSSLPRAIAGFAPFFWAMIQTHSTRNLQDRFSTGQLIMGTPFEQLVSKSSGFVEAPALGWNYLFDIRGTVFQQRVASVAGNSGRLDGELYDIAQRIGLPKSVRAVAQFAVQTL